MSLAQDQSAGQVLLGIGAGTAGTLQLGNFNLTTQQLVLGDGGGGTATILRGTGTLTVAGTLTVNGTGGNSFTFAAGDVTASLNLVSGGKATTAATGNVTQGVTVSGAGSRLTLAAPLSVGDSVDNSVSGGGVLDAQGFAITTPANAGLSITGVSGVTNPLLNVGTVTVGNYTQAGGSQVTLGAGDSTVGSLTLRGNSTLAVGLPGGTARLTVSNTPTNAVAIESGSQLALTLDGSQPGYVLRWANPNGGDHIADLNSLISSGAITLSLTNGAMFTVGSDGAYTYVLQPVPEPAHLLLAAAAGVGLVRVVRRRTGV